MLKISIVTEPPSIAHGGRGLVVPGCPHCRKRIQTVGQFVDHLVDDVMPKILGEVAARNGP